MFAPFSLPVILMALMTIVHIGAAADPTSVILEKLRQIHVRTQKRQSSNGGLSVSEVPAQCQQGCTPIINALNTCSAVACLCSAVIDSSIGQCVSCCANIKLTATAIQDGEKAFDLYNTICKGTGVSSLILSITASQSGSGAPTSTPGAGVTVSSSTPKLPSAAIGAFPSLPFASIGLVVALLITLLA